MRALFTMLACMTALFNVAAQNVDKIELSSSEYENSGDIVTIQFNILRTGNTGDEHVKNINVNDLKEHLKFYEDGKEISNVDYEVLRGGVRIPKGTTISVLIDKGIGASGKKDIITAIRNLVDSAPDSCVYLSFFGKETSYTKIVTRSNFESFNEDFDSYSGEKYFYGALYYKLLEFNENEIDRHEEYLFNPVVSKRAKTNSDKNFMFIFVDGNKPADVDDPIQYNVLTQNVGALVVKPTIYAFYYSSTNDLDEGVRLTLTGITGGSSKMNFPKSGKYVSTSNNQEILSSIGESIEDLMSDYALKYKARPTGYKGRVSFSAEWDNENKSKTTEFTIGTEENPWPIHKESTSDFFLKLFIALLVTFLTIALFFVIQKILIPFIKSKAFSAKYYKKYQPEYGVQKRICSYCKQPLEPGQMVVAKCKHIMHVHCWKENDYRCAEYGQNCNTGIQEYVDWKNLFSKSSLRDCRQVITGICTGAFSWIIYEIMKRKAFTGLSRGIASTFLTGDNSHVQQLLGTCSSKIASFLAIGMLLGFFLSFVFRWNEEYRKKDTALVFKIIGLSLLSSFIGLMAFAFGGILLCMLIPASATTIPWYCAIPAYILFSVCESLSLTIKTSIPIKSAMLGGLCSAVIGFLVLYFTNGFNSRHLWMNMLLDFIIYGGGLGASLITARILAEKYFLVIQNGIKYGTRIPIHKWMGATGGGNKVTIGMTGDCEIQMNWEKSNKVAKEHAVLYVDHTKSMPVIKPLATNVIYNTRAELPVRKPAPLTNGDTFKIGDTIFLYEETD